MYNHFFFPGLTLLWMECLSSPPAPATSNSHIDTLSPNVMVFGDGVFGGQLGLDEAMKLCLTDGFSVLIRWGRETWALSPSTMWGHREKAVVCKPGRKTSPGIKPAGTLILDFSAPRTMKNIYLLFKPFSLWHFVRLVWADWYKHGIIFWCKKCK